MDQARTPVGRITTPAFGILAQQMLPRAAPSRAILLAMTPTSQAIGWSWEFRWLILSTPGLIVRKVGIGHQHMTYNGPRPIPTDQIPRFQLISISLKILMVRKQSHPPTRLRRLFWELPMMGIMISRCQMDSLDMFG